MDFLKSAVASAISKGPPFPYTFGDRVDIEQSIWTLTNGTRREDGSDCSIFSFDVAANKACLALARNAVKKLRTLRHPGVVKVLDTVETDTYIYVATERVVPLRWHIKRKSLSPETIKWGLHSVASTIRFINNEAASIHGSIKAASVYTSESGEWKLGGFEVVSNIKEDEAMIYTYGSLVPDSARYAPPELARGGWDAIKQAPHTAVDSFHYGALAYEVFNGDFTGTHQVGQTKNIPPSMQSSYRRLVNPNPKARLSVAHFLEQGRRAGSFFDSPLIKLTEGVESLGMKTPEERDRFLGDLDQLADDFPEDFFKLKVLPELLRSVEFGGGGPKALDVVLKIASKLSSDDFDSKVTPVVVRLFANPDRAIRVALLDSLPLMIDRLPQKIVNDKIFPPLVTGFTDVAPVVREQTLKSVLVVVGKLSDRTINGELLRYLAKTANDEQPGIRTNTTICLGKLAKNLGTSTRTKVLIAAFLRSLRDPFVHARNAALMALAVTVEYFSGEDCAARILPALCPLLVDKEKPVRDQASKTMDVYVAKVRKAASGMPESALPPPHAGDGGAVPRMSTPQPNESSAASWAGWAISSFTNKISAAAGDMQTEHGNGPSRPGSTNPEARKPAPLFSSSASVLHRQAVAASPASTPPISRTSSQVAGAAPEELFPAEGGSATVADDDDGWGGFGDDAFFDAEDGASSATKTASATVSTKPYDDESEPDFAAWLAAKAEKKPGPSKGMPLPKGLAKVSPATTAGRKPSPATAAKTAPKPGKKIDLKPKVTEGDDDGWGDGW